ncbi:MAG: tRNA dihydrouridine(20/20a) synthase DusA [Gammaproteobacteria bacterium]|jgi:tRNA-dihydrouridine synthase A|nr:tRNA dihydrouridine(20/20a) synthase DusA [Gammaproteobacteria bacterium]
MNTLIAASQRPGLAVAPMMDWTDRHCRYFHRLLAPSAWLYTEMVTTGALLHGDVQRHLAYAEREHPLALQLGGSVPDDLAQCCRLAEEWGYDEVNLNVGCPSDRVQRGAFGACLMHEPELVRDCLGAMRAASAVPVSIKSRIGVDELDSWTQLENFYRSVAESGVQRVIVHARKAWLKGLSPKQNREIPDLNYQRVYRLKREFPHFEVIVNGGITAAGQITGHLQHVDGVMIGRAAYQIPWMLTECELLMADSAHPAERDQPDRDQILEQMIAYAHAQQAQGVPVRHIGRHLLGLYHGRPGGKLWRRQMSECLQDHSAAPESWRRQTIQSDCPEYA